MDGNMKKRIAKGMPRASVERRLGDIEKRLSRLETVTADIDGDIVDLVLLIEDMVQTVPVLVDCRGSVWNPEKKL